MAKTTNKTTPTTKRPQPPVPTPESAPAKVRKERKERKSVFVIKTASELRDMIGADTPIGVSRTDLTNIVLAARKEELLAGTGL
jgi:hypothetical protein